MSELSHLDAEGRARMIDVGSHSLEIRCEGSGSPTVVFENGALPLIDIFTDFKKVIYIDRLPPASTIDSLTHSTVGSSR